MRSPLRMGAEMMIFVGALSGTRENSFKNENFDETVIFIGV